MVNLQVNSTKIREVPLSNIPQTFELFPIKALWSYAINLWEHIQNPD